MKILIADDHPVVRDALAHTVARLDDQVEVCHASDHDSLLRCAQASGFDLALVDLNMPGMAGTAGLEGLRRLRQCQPTLPVVVVTGRDDPGLASAALQAGASGFVAKTEAAEVLLQALRVVLGGGVFLPAHALLQMRDGAAPAAPVLTPRQRDVLALLQRGQPNKGIARQLGLTEGTVKLHVAALLRALRARNRTDAVLRAHAWLRADA